MKKFLLATTVLGLSAGIAAAEVKVTGNGRMGVVYKGQTINTTVDPITGVITESSDNGAFNFSSRIRIVFTASGETDGGLTFGGSIRADNSAGGALGASGSIYISGAFGKLSMGDVVGATEAALFDLPEIGYEDVSGFNELPTLTGDGSNGLTAPNNPVLLYSYSAGDLSFYLSASDGKAALSSTDLPQEYGVGVSYAFGDYSVGIGYEKVDGNGVFDGATGLDLPSPSQITVGGSATFGTTTVNAYYARRNEDDTFGDSKYYGIGVTSVFGAVTVMGFVNRYDVDEDRGTAQILAGSPRRGTPFGYGQSVIVDTTAYGIGASYDLGGGASIVGGITDDNTKICGVIDCYSTKPIADLGMKFTF